VKPYKDPQVLKHYINRLYEAVLEPKSMASIMSDLRGVVDAEYSAFQVESLYTFELRQALLIGYDEASIESYTQYYVAQDPWSVEVLKKGLVDQPFMSGHKMLADNIYRESEFYQDWGRHHGVRHVIGTSLTLDDGFVFKANFQRHDDQDPFDEELETFLNWLHPHFKHFVRLSSIFQHQQGLHENWQQPLLHLNRPVWVVDEHMNLVFHNHCADEWLRDSSYLSCIEGQLMSPDYQQNKILKQSVARFSGLSMVNSLKYQGSLMHQYDRVTLGSAESLESFWLSPLMSQGEIKKGLVMIIGRKPLPNINMLMQYHHLTQRQAQICLLLMQGVTPQQAAQKLNISLNTVRNTISACFRVLNVKNQSELIRLLYTAL